MKQETKKILNDDVRTRGSRRLWRKKYPCKRGKGEHVMEITSVNIHKYRVVNDPKIHKTKFTELRCSTCGHKDIKIERLVV